MAADLNIGATGFGDLGHVQQAQLAGQANQSWHRVLQLLLELQQLRPQLIRALQVALAVWLSLQRTQMFAIVAESWLLPIWRLRELSSNLAGAQRQAVHLFTHAQTFCPQAGLLVFWLLWQALFAWRTPSPCLRHPWPDSAPGRGVPLCLAVPQQPCSCL